MNSIVGIGCLAGARVYPYAGFTQSTRPLHGTVLASDFFRLTNHDEGYQILPPVRNESERIQSISISRVREHGADTAYSVAILSTSLGPCGPVLSSAVKTYTRQDPSAVGLHAQPQTGNENGLPEVSNRFFSVRREGDVLQEMGNEATPAYLAPVEFFHHSICQGEAGARTVLTNSKGVGPSMLWTTGQAMSENEKFQFGAEIARGLLSADASPEEATRIMDRVGQALVNQKDGSSLHGPRHGVNTETNDWFVSTPLPFVGGEPLAWS